MSDAGEPLTARRAPEAHRPRLRSIGAVSSAVVRHGENRTVEPTVLGQQRDRRGHGDVARAGASAGSRRRRAQQRGGICGMHVARDQARVGWPVMWARWSSAPGETRLGPGVGHVAEMGGHVRVPVGGHQAERRLEIAARGQDHRTVEAVDGRHRHGQRRVPPRTAQRQCRRPDRRR